MDVLCSRRSNLFKAWNLIYRNVYVYFRLDTRTEFFLGDLRSAARKTCSDNDRRKCVRESRPLAKQY